ncbi:MAG: O-antigen ligase family protein [Phycisphaerae bacterium]|nr:O-antigen ligase family protein [Phycisphaerae bacterium]
MTRNPTQTIDIRKTVTGILDVSLLVVILVIAALRATITEGPLSQAATRFDLASPVFSLTVSTILFAAAMIWLFIRLWQGAFTWKPTFAILGFLLFAAASAVSIYIASNKRAAINSVAITLAPVLAGLLLVQILNTSARLKVVFAVLACAAIVNAWQSGTQLFSDNQLTIAEYEKDQSSFLTPLGIEPDSFEHMLFEHRLYSKDIKGFFTTSNSAGSFTLLAFFACIAFISMKMRESVTRAIPVCIAALCVLFGLIITKSKGAIGGLLFASAMFIVYVFFDGWIKRHKKAIAVIAVLLIVISCSGIIAYGVKNDTLPGGNSMLVRWQYWSTTAKLIAAHPFGIGPANFSYYYPGYKVPQALETVSDPHNFVLSIAAQYGLFGLAAFFILIAVPIYKSILSKDFQIVTEKKSSIPGLSVLVGILTAVVLLFVRPFAMPITATSQSSNQAVLFAAIYLYVFPVLIFCGGLCLFAVNLEVTGKDKAIQRDLTGAAMLCGLAGFFLHNLIDFAIFEPAVWMALWIYFFAMVAYFNYGNEGSCAVGSCKKWIFMGAAVVLGCLYVAFVFLPRLEVARAVAIATEKPPQYAHPALAKAIEKDRFDPLPAAMDGKLYLQQYQELKDKKLLQNAVGDFQIAIERNRADFANYESLANTYLQLAQNAPNDSEKRDFYTSALKNYELAADRYPGSTRLRLGIAKTAQILGNKELAIANYRMVVEIEDAYREQFRRMYPDRKIVSRIGEANYKIAQKQLAELEQGM